MTHNPAFRCVNLIADFGPEGGRATPQADSRSDGVLVAAAQAGDDAAFGVLVARHARSAFTIARAVVGNAELAEDVCQEALMRIWQRLRDCKKPERFANWLAVSVRRHALNALRTRRRTRELSSELVDKARRPDQHVEAADTAAVLERALQQLSSEQRQAVLLFDLEGWSHLEIAASLGTTEAMSRQHLMLGRRKLRQLLTAKELRDV